MTRDSATVHKTTRTNTPPASAAITATTIDATLVTNGLDITDFWDYKNPKLIVTNSSGAVDLTIKAGNLTSSGLGDYVVEIGSSATVVIDQLESARHIQSSIDSSLWVDFESGFTGTIYAIGDQTGLV